MESIEMSISKSSIPRGNYTVKAGDSLMSIVARVGNVTPAQLASFNRLGMLGAGHPPLFPGQRLYIPSADEVRTQRARPRRLPGSATRVRYFSVDLPEPCGGVEGTPRMSQNTSPVSVSEERTAEGLLVKVKAKRVLLPSKSEIDGVLIVTPDAVCFDAVATAEALNRAVAARRGGPRFLSSDDSGNGWASSPLGCSSPLEPVLVAAEPIHNVLALSVCIPITAIISLNTHVDMTNLLSGCRSNISGFSLPKDPVSTESRITLPPDSSGHNEEFSHCGGHPSISSELEQGCEHVPEEIFISIGVEIDRIFSSVAATPTSLDHTTLSEAATTNLHVFKIPFDVLGDIQDTLVSATNLATSQLISSNSDAVPKPPHHMTQDQRTTSNSMIESALEMEKTTFDITIVGDAGCILNEAMLKDLSEGLPANRVGSAMKLIFSTAKDGFSLNTLYRKTKCVQDANLLLICDQLGSVFGALLSEKMHCSQHFYGTGESCVFHWKDGFKCYNWTKKNYFFMQGSRDSFLIGAKSGHSAIWFDGDLKYGRSEATDTFDNPVLCSIPNANSRKVTDRVGAVNTLSPNPRLNSLPNTTGPSSVAFVISSLEVWEMIA